MDKMKEVVICLGSSCFARGNKKLLKVVQTYIKENHLEGNVIFKGNHCFGKCNKGPFLKIDDNFYEQLTELKLLEVLKKELG
jgi:NADH:ubiquinone oxidoreductase subunit E